MAINEVTPNDVLDRPQARAAGALCAVLGLAAAALLIVALTVGGISGDRQFWTIVLVVLSLGAAAAGGVLMSLRHWAQRALLLFWLIVALFAGGLTLSALQAQNPAWWTAGVPWYAVLPEVFAASCLAIVLLVLASRPLSRLRYASMVTVSIAVAAALVGAVNLLAANDKAVLRKDIETLGRYSLSDRSEAILKDLDGPVELTCVYTPGYKELSDEERRTLDSRRQRVMELLQEMREQNRSVTISSISSDLEKARLVERLRRQLSSQAAEHVKFLDAFLKQSEGLEKLLRQQEQKWSPKTPLPYLADWGLPARIADSMKTQADELAKAAREIETQVGALPNYAKLTQQASDVLKKVADAVQAYSSLLDQLAKVPTAVSAGEKPTIEKVQAAVKATQAMIAAIGKPDEPAPADAAGAMKKIIETSTKAHEAMAQAAEALRNIAGSDLAPVLEENHAWVELVPVGPLQLPTPLPDLVQSAAKSIDEGIRQRAQGVLKNATADYQVQYIQQLRKDVPSFAKSIENLQTRVRQSIDAVARPDAQSQDIFAQQKAGTLFQPILAPVKSLSDQAGKLPSIPASSLTDDVLQDNIVIAEAGGKTEVVSFEDVWPMQPGSDSMTQLSADADKKRVFNGDSAVGTKILKMTHEAFGTVVLAYAAPSPTIARGLPGLVLTPESLTALKKRLEDANFKVQTWNLAEPMPADETASKDEPATQPATASAPAASATTAPAAKPQRVLLVLPPPPVMPPNPYSGEEPVPGLDASAVTKIKQAVDTGTPAIILGRFLPTRAELPPVYIDLNTYLRKDWGLQFNNAARLVGGRADAKNPGKFRLDAVRWWYLPLSTFTSHPIGRPLQGQRMLWKDLCPIQTLAAPAGVKVEPVLQVPPYLSDVWAATNVVELIDKVRGNEGSLVAPEAEDIVPPIDLAVAASREGGKDLPPVRIVVAALAGGLEDQYLQEPIETLNPDQTVSVQPPPRSDADVIVNSVYWLLGRQGYIAAGPAEVRPIAQLDQKAQWILQAIFIGALPLVLLSAGGVVLFVRKR